jgi:LDH2 family malate/lactate/ureidoglycolate dehydrogenase
VEILAGVLAGAAISHGLGNMYTDFSRPQNIGHWLAAIDVTHFAPYEMFVGRMQSLVELAHSTKPAPGFDGVLVPGEPEERIREQRLREGIPLADATVTELRQLGLRHGVDFPRGSAS